MASNDGDDNVDTETLSTTENEPLDIIRTWIFISLLSQVMFGYTTLFEFMKKLYQNFQKPERIKPKEKALGGYSPSDPLR